MLDFFSGAGATVKEVAHLDLEESFVELLSSTRPEVWAGRNGSGPGNEGDGGRVDEPAVSGAKEED